MLAWLVLGAVFGAVCAWAAYAGIYEDLKGTCGIPGRRLPHAFWRRSAVIAAAGAVIGAALMWRAVFGAGRF